MLLVRKPEALDAAYIPDNLKLREKEIQAIEQAVIQPLRSGSSNVMMVYGPSGVGKTTTMKFIQKTFGDIAVLYENAIAHTSMRQVLLDSLNRLGRINPSLFLSYESIFGYLNKYQARTGKKILLIVDEARNCLRSDPEGLRIISKAHETFGTMISVIFVSIENPINFVPGITGNMGIIFSTLRFRQYDVEELYSIAMERCRIALIDEAYDEVIVRYIAGMAEQFGSARVAIELLQKAAHIAEYRNSGTIGSDDVRAARAMINPFFTESKLGELDIDELIMLWTICRCIGHGVRTNVSCVSKMLSDTAQSFGVKLRKSMNVYRVLKRLENMGLVESRIMGMGDRKGVNKVIEINDLPVSVLSEKIERLIRGIA